MTNASPSGSANNRGETGRGQDRERASEVSEGTNYYALLGVRPGASPQEIRRAYRDLSKLYHPDTTVLEGAIATVKFQALNEAYATLSSPEKRLAYDYKIGYSRISVMQPASPDPANRAGQTAKAYPANAYLDPNDRPLSAGELFALFILGVTFVGCLLLVVAIGFTQGEMAAAPEPPPAVSPSVLTQPDASQPNASQPNASQSDASQSDTSSGPGTALPDSSRPASPKDVLKNWLAPEAPSQPPVLPTAPSPESSPPETAPPRRLVRQFPVTL